MSVLVLAELLPLLLVELALVSEALRLMLPAVRKRNPVEVLPPLVALRRRLAEAMLVLADLPQLPAVRLH